MSRRCSVEPDRRLTYRVFDTPAGTLTVVCDASATGDRDAGSSGPVVASGFGPVGAVAPAPVDSMTAADLPEVAEAVAAYFNGDVNALDHVAVAQSGPDFHLAAWRAMRDIPAGQAWTYGELAAAAGNPRASRAAGSACATNTVAPFVPCHRIVRSGGALGQYGYGPATKEQLLRHEGYLGA